MNVGAHAGMCAMHECLCKFISSYVMLCLRLRETAKEAAGDDTSYLD